MTSLSIPQETFPGKFTLVTPPAVEPLTTAEAKTHLQVTFSDDDAYIGGLITAVRKRFEGEIDRAFVTQTWDYTIETFPLILNDRQLWRRVQNVITIPKAPLVSITSFSYIAPDGSTQTLAEGTDYLKRTGDPGAVYPYPVTRIWPQTQTRLDAVTIRFVAGYGDNTAVPETIKAAIKLMIGHLYMNRVAVTGVQGYELPLAVGYLLNAESWGSRP
jgi:uncharacterized phiE125 gp8 family phage protein